MRMVSKWSSTSSLVTAHEFTPFTMAEYRATTPSNPPQPSVTQGGAAFNAVVNRVEPVAERVCRERRPNANCDFLILVDTRPGLPPNAFQTLNKQGRPVIGFTSALIGDDEGIRKLLKEFQSGEWPEE